VLGIHEIGQYIQLWRAIDHTLLTDEPDRLQWQWTTNGTYAAKSCYLATFHGSTTSRSWKLLWKSWAPPRVRFFHWLADLDRCWTAERLARRGLPHHTACHLYDQGPETMQHLLVECAFSRQIWHETIAWLRIPCSVPTATTTSLLDWWHEAKQDIPKQMHKGLSTAALLVPWMIWKQRNSCVFEGAQASISNTLQLIKEEAMQWARAGALGLRTLLPQTWDVH
jgi:hypothetical protein